MNSMQLAHEQLHAGCMETTGDLSDSPVFSFCQTAEARAAVRTEAGYRASAGVAANKLLAKLCRCGALGWAGRSVHPVLVELIALNATRIRSAGSPSSVAMHAVLDWSQRISLLPMQRPAQTRRPDGAAAP